MAGPKFYAVRVGITPGIYRTWAECEPQVHGVQGAKYKSFPTMEQAEEYLNSADGPRPVDTKPSEKPTGKRRAKEQSSRMPEPCEMSLPHELSELHEMCGPSKVPNLSGRNEMSESSGASNLSGRNEIGEAVSYGVPRGTLVAFVDGSYDAKSRRYGYGCVLLTDDGREICENGWGNHPQAVSARNVAGELQGTLKALRRAEEMGYKSIRICHDYSGIAAWFQGEWKANSFVAKEYVAAVEAYRGVLTVTFEKVAAHTGVKYNEMADRLAKDALGIE